MHEGLIWLFHPKPQGAAQPHRRSRDSHFPPINLSVWFSVWLSSFPSPPHLFCMGAAKHPREHTYTQKKTHISIHSCRAVRSNLDSHREWIVMQTGGRGGAQTGCQRAAARLCPTCLFLPCGVRLCTISLLQVFLSLSISSGWTTAVTFSLPSFHQTDPRSLESKMEFRDQHFWSNNVNIDAKNSPPRAVALVVLHANAGSWVVWIRWDVKLHQLPRYIKRNLT